MVLTLPDNSDGTPGARESVCVRARANCRSLIDIALDLSMRFSRSAQPEESWNARGDVPCEMWVSTGRRDWQISQLLDDDGDRHACVADCCSVIVQVERASVFNAQAVFLSWMPSCRDVEVFFHTRLFINLRSIPVFDGASPVVGLLTPCCEKLAQTFPLSKAHMRVQQLL